ncbi:MAG: DinB family protein [Phycisphaerae bacterium]
MTNDRVPWFERTFNFDFPVGCYRYILERLCDTPLRVEAKVQGLGPEVLARRDGNTWSIQENVGHLGDLEPLWTGRLDDFLDGEEFLRAADLTNQKTHSAKHNETSVEQVIDSFSSQRKAFVGRLEALSAEAFGRTALHPRLKVPMRLVDMCFFVAEHDDYHLARIAELSRSFAGAGR